VAAMIRSALADRQVPSCVRFTTAGAGAQATAYAYYHHPTDRQVMHGNRGSIGEVASLRYCRPMSTISVADGEIAAWCRGHLGSESAEVLFTMGHLSSVSGLALRDGRQIVLKIRPTARRLVACAAVHRHLYRAGFPCPQPLAGPEPLAGYAADAELLVPGG